jgi:hypothetical protein
VAPVDRAATAERFMDLVFGSAEASMRQPT